MNLDKAIKRKQAQPAIKWRVDEHGSLAIRISGDCLISTGSLATDELFAALEKRKPATAVYVDISGVNRWDSALPLFIRKVSTYCQGKGMLLDTTALPDSMHVLLLQSSPANAEKAAQAEHGKACAGNNPLNKFLDESREQFKFIGITAIAAVATARGKVRHRRGTLAYLFNQCGPNAVPIVTLISILVGMILAFIGAVQLRQFGAQIYIADLVGLGMAREMGAMMTAVIAAGRTGAAYAAELGSMKVNEEIDALRTLGVKPVELLVIPRVAALMLAMPLLCVYADCMGIIGGALVAVGLFDITILEYFNESRNWLHPSDFNMGIGKSVVFAALVAIAGCMRGMRCGANSSEVGNAATSAVVTGIVWVVVADAILTLLITTLEL